MKKQNSDVVNATQILFGGLMAGTSIAALWLTVSLLFSFLG